MTSKAKSTRNTLKAVISDLVSKNLDRTAEYQTFVDLKDSIEELKALHNDNARLNDNAKQDEYIAKRREVSHKMLPLIDQLVELEMFHCNSKGQGGLTTTDSLAQPFENSGISFTLQNQWCENCQNWGGVFGCPRCGADL